MRQELKRYVWKILLRLMDVRMAVRSEDILPAESREEIKSLLKTGDILLESNNAYLSSQIVAKLLFRTNWIHAAIYVGDEKVVDSGRNPSVALNDLDQFLLTTDLGVYRPKYASPEDVSAAVSFANKAVGKPFNITLDDTHGHSFYCTQLVSEALLSMPHPIQLPIRHLLWKQIVPPAVVATSPDLECIWSSHPQFFSNIGAHLPLSGKVARVDKN
jgi:hypothetical protein